jgi:tellurite resistance protein TerC
MTGGISTISAGPDVLQSKPFLWGVLTLVLVACMGADLWFHRRPSDIPFRESVRWTSIWLAIACAFAGCLWAALGADEAGQFAAIYVTEWSLSVDNVLAFVVLIAALRVPRSMRHRVLLIGALGAIAPRLIFIILGVALVERFEWLMYGFGLVLLVAGVRLVWNPRRASHGAPPLQHLRGWLRIGSPMVAAVVVVVTADLAFALDSIPAAFAFSLDTFLIFSANAFAVLGLRSLYFAVEGAVQRFRFVRPALGSVLVFVSLKMVGASVVEVPTGISLAVIAVILGTAGFAGWYASRRGAGEAPTGREVLEMGRPVAAHGLPYPEESR